MSRPTNQLRGARIAYAQCQNMLETLPLFPTMHVQPELAPMLFSIMRAAEEVMLEHQSLREARRQAHVK